MKNIPVLLFFICSIILSCSSSEKKYDLAANREIVKKFHQVWSNGKVEQLKAMNGEGLTEPVGRSLISIMLFRIGMNK
jgi:hypothetical protein